MELGYDIKFDVCRLYNDHTYDTSQYTRKHHQHASSICAAAVVNNEAKQESCFPRYILLGVVMITAGGHII